MTEQSVFANNTGILDDEVEEVRKLIGVPMRIKQWNLEASIDGIRHYAHGLGDANPLYTEEEYGATSSWGSVVAPPTFLYAIWPPGVGPGFPGLQAFYAGCRWELNRYVRPGERIFAESKMTELLDKQGKRAGRMLIQKGETVYRTADGEVVGTNYSRAFRIPRPSAGGGLNYGAKPPHPWTLDEIIAMEDEVLAQTRRGAEPRYWEDTKVGDRLQDRLKGPLDQSTMITYYAGNLGGNASTDIAIRNRHVARTRPDLVPNNRPAEILAERTAYGQGHHDPKVAASVGMPGVYDNGYMRIGWAQQLVTDWMGDDAFLRSLDCSINLPNVLGDTVRYRGTVSRVYEQAGEHLVDIDITYSRQDEELSGKGTATVRLPSRNAA
ncbi:FAS1-like dehydratase domain-containing protein [Rhodococcoides fascians]|uniref:FAS1-like dehydratase domain-containing protein n=1 Tax=Rhodococcoides fascians TaxID=1828 RepID=UPI0005643385|nr:MaoC family dehydratase N-terminal domain-containing protein [Rhodococcus fascians]